MPQIGLGHFYMRNGMGLPLYEAVNGGDTSPRGPFLLGCPVSWYQANQAEGWVCSPLLQLGSCRAGLQQAGRMKDAMISTSIRFQQREELIIPSRPKGQSQVARWMRAKAFPREGKEKPDPQTLGLEINLHLDGWTQDLKEAGAPRPVLRGSGRRRRRRVLSLGRNVFCLTAAKGPSEARCCCQAGSQGKRPLRPLQRPLGEIDGAPAGRAEPGSSSAASQVVPPPSPSVRPPTQLQG